MRSENKFLRILSLGPPAGSYCHGLLRHSELAIQKSGREKLEASSAIRTVESPVRRPRVRSEDGTFEDAALQAGVAYNGDGKALSFMDADFRDYDNDGREDLVTTALSNETHLFPNLGGRFVEMTYPAGIGKASFPWTGWSTGLVDFNNDGWKDIFTANGHVMGNADPCSRTWYLPSRRQVHGGDAARGCVPSRRGFWRFFPGWLHQSGGLAAEPGAAGAAKQVLGKLD